MTPEQLNLLRIAAPFGTSALGGLLGYLITQKQHKFEGAARGAGLGYMTGIGASAGALAPDAILPEKPTIADRAPYTIAGGLAGFGVGRLLQGEPAWEKRQKLREDLLAAIREEHKLQKTGSSSVITGLIDAKRLSDMRAYKGKHARLRMLIQQHPDDFVIDSQENGIVGLTHKSGFRIHAPMDVLPLVQLKRVDNASAI